MININDNQKKMIMENVLLTREVAKILRVSETYIRELIRSKKIKAYQEGRRGGYRIPKEEIDRYIQVKLNGPEMIEVIPERQ